MKVWKILRPTEERLFSSSESWHGSADDIRDGFVHLSTEEQIVGTLERHFASESVVHVFAFAAQSFADLRWERSRGGQDFPHLYAALRTQDVVERRIWRRGPEGWIKE